MNITSISCVSLNVYAHVQNAYTSVFFTYNKTTICYNQTVYNDVRLESDEWTGLTLQIGASTARTVTVIDHTEIRIIDDDGL